MIPVSIGVIDSTKLLLLKEFLKISKMHKLWKKNKGDEEEKIRKFYKGEEKWDRRCIYFTIILKILVKYARTPTQIYNKILNTNNLTWLQTRIAYHEYRILGKLFNAYLATKLNKGLLSLDLIERSCKCMNWCKITGQCSYNKKYRTLCVV